MRPWLSHNYRTAGIAAGVDPAVIDAAVVDVQTLLAITPQAAPLLSLGHLAHESGVSYKFLRSVISRSSGYAYLDFVIVGRSGKRRNISTPTRDLMTVQRWIAENILASLPVGPNVHSYAKGSSILQCARAHCESRWLVKVDVRSFFASIDERRMVELFAGLGYRPLVAFELARLCTWPVQVGSGRPTSPRSSGADYSSSALGSLPIGAPTSPMLSNVYMAPFDRAMSLYCAQRNLVFTRYADDVFVSSQDRRFSRSDGAAVAQFVREQLKLMRLADNHAKGAIIPPGARKVVLGLLVNAEVPRLSPEFKKRMRMHYHFIERFGFARHADERNFPSVPMLERHLRGLIAFASQVETDYGARLLEKHNAYDWSYLK
jgi:RNA-directed DNA polymerase